MRRPWKRRGRLDADTQRQQDIHDREVGAARAATAEAEAVEQRADQLEQRLDAATRIAVARRRVPMLAMPVLRAN